MKAAKRSDPPRTTSDPTALEEQIRCRAYELYEARGRQDGHGLDDWLRAEAEILIAQQTTTAA